jgi:hypothetical protein
VAGRTAWLLAVQAEVNTTTVTSAARVRGNISMTSC